MMFLHINKTLHINKFVNERSGKNSKFPRTRVKGPGQGWEQEAHPEQSFVGTLRMLLYPKNHKSHFTLGSQGSMLTLEETELYKLSLKNKNMR
jgi:hypothetical protein